MQNKEAGIQLIAKNGTQHELSAQGWDAFLKQKRS